MHRRDVALLTAVIVAPWVLIMLALVWVDLVPWSTFITTVLVSAAGGILIGVTLGSPDDYPARRTDNA